MNIRKIPNPVSFYKNRHSCLKLLEDCTLKIPLRLAYHGLPFTGNDRKLIALRNKHLGQRCFLIGNGPSLKKMNLRPLKKEITFGVNGIFYLFEEMEFLPTYYTVEDVFVAEDNKEKINSLGGMVKIFPKDLKYCLRPSPETLYINFIRNYQGFPRFSPDITDCAYWGSTVTYMNMQLAYYMGIRKIYMIGMDFSYKIPDYARGSEITSRESDKNHFHPDYFGPGKRWHHPRLDRVEKAFEKARHFIEENGGEIYNATAGGNLDIFPRVDYDGILNCG